MELPADHQVIGYQEHTINKCYNVDIRLSLAKQSLMSINQD